MDYEVKIDDKDMDKIEDYLKNRKKKSIFRKTRQSTLPWLNRKRNIDIHYYTKMQKPVNHEIEKIKERKQTELKNVEKC